MYYDHCTCMSYDHRLCTYNDHSTCMYYDTFTVIMIHACTVIKMFDHIARRRRRSLVTFSAIQTRKVVNNINPA